MMMVKSSVRSKKRKSVVSVQMETAKGKWYGRIEQYERTVIRLAAILALALSLLKIGFYEASPIVKKILDYISALSR